MGVLIVCGLFLLDFVEDGTVLFLKRGIALSSKRVNGCSHSVWAVPL